MMKMLLALALVILSSASWVRADFGKDEPTLFPAGSGTADTLRSGEVALGPPWGGWIARGFGDRVTLGWDYPAALFAGIPAFLARATPFDPKSPLKFSVEAYIADWKSTYTDKRNKNFLLEHRGLSFWVHGLATWRLAENLRIHLYGGTSYAQFERYSQHQGASFAPSEFHHAYSPDYGGTLEWEMTPWLKFLINGMRGNSFYFVDQVSRKTMAVYAFDLAPFSTGSVGILRTLRIELAALWVWMPIAGHYSESLALPIFPWFYWQFNW